MATGFQFWRCTMLNHTGNDGSQVVWCAGLVMVLVLLGSFSSVVGQTSTGRIVGSVKDSTGAVAPGVEMFIDQLGTGFTFNTTTNAMGEFIAPQLQPGQYRVTAKRSGFKTFVQTPVTVRVNEDAGVIITLEL